MSYKFQVGDMFYVGNNPQLIGTIIGVMKSGRYTVKWKNTGIKDSYWLGSDFFPLQNGLDKLKDVL